jgi:threonine dehydrogenase-like Zn-dependent dehydrogenase
MGEAPTIVKPQYKHREDGSTMKALVWFGTTDVRVIDTPIPDVTEPDDVIVKVTGTAICGSDLHLYHGEILALQKGDILGHEVRLSLVIPAAVAQRHPSSWGRLIVSEPTSRI